MKSQASGSASNFADAFAARLMIEQASKALCDGLLVEVICATATKDFEVISGGCRSVKDAREEQATSRNKRLNSFSVSSPMPSYWEG